MTPRVLSRCYGTHGKIAYKRERVATMIAARALTYGKLVYVYRCKRCGLFHLTRSAPRE